MKSPRSTQRYIPTQEGWPYVAVIIDLHSKAVIGWSMDSGMNSSLVENALTMALFRRRFPKNVIVHSDKGSAAMESFFHTLKVELVHDENYVSIDVAKTSIVEYIECYYNRKRRHSFIDYMIPEQFESQELLI